MPIQILMPALSPTMTEGTLAKWLKKEGETVESGEVIAEIETDKATMEIEAVDEGVLGKILVAEGTEGVAINQPIALILEEGEDPSVLEGALDKIKAAPQPAPQTKAAQPIPAAAPPPAPAAQPASAPPPAAPRQANTDRRVFASPLARRLAAEQGIDLAGVQGSGPHGRIIQRDLEGASVGVAAPSPAVQAVPQSIPGADYAEVPHTTMRKIIAERLSLSKREIPHFYLTIDCRIDNLLDMRRKLNAEAPEGEGAYKISVNDIVLRAVALALRKVPEANASWTDAALRLYNRVDVAVAVATPGGLITPIVRDADEKGLAEISGEMRDLAARAREGKLAPEEYQGGGFTISNLGMFGVKEFSAVINPPQACILAVGAGEQRPVVTRGALAIATVMTCTLSVDHRAVDGAVGARFLQAYKAFVEEPLTMLL